jgi:hypothetical protein
MVSGQLHAPAALPCGNRPRYPLDRGLGGPQSRTGRCGEEKNIFDFWNTFFSFKALKNEYLIFLHIKIGSQITNQSFQQDKFCISEVFRNSSYRYNQMGLAFYIITGLIEVAAF